MKIIEILQYTLHKGTGAAFHRLMLEISVPLHQHHQIDVVSFGHSLHDPDSYYLIRAFASMESMESSLAAFYASADWRDGPREAIVRSIDTALKTVIALPRDSVDGLRLQ